MVRSLTGWKRDFAIGAAIVGLLTAAGVLFAELTDSPASVRPFLLTAVVLAAWQGGWPGALVATTTAVAVFAVYSTGHSVETLVSTYVGALDGDEALANERIHAALGSKKVRVPTA